MGEDKILHACISAGIAMIVTLCTKSLLSGLENGVTITTLKEVVYDKAMGLGTPDIEDIYFNILGVCAGLGLVLLFRRVK